jgi:hypothetical protein
MRRFLAFLCAALLLASPAGAVPSAWTVYSSGPLITQLGTATTSGIATTAVLTTIADAPAHSTIIVFAASEPNAFATTWMTDSNGDTFTLKKFTVLSSANGGAAYVVNTASDLPAGSTITLTLGSSTHGSLVAIDAKSLNGGADVTGAQTTGTASSTSVPTGALAQPVELVCGATFFLGTNPGTWTEAVGFTSETQQTGGPDIFPACQAVFSTAGSTYAPSWANSVLFGANVWSWKSP